MSIVGLRRIREKIEQEISERSISLGRGEANSFDVYRQNVGYIEGLYAAIAICDEVEKDYN